MIKVTLKDVCREASVSAATVSRVINDSPLVHKDTRLRVMEAIDALGYTPNAAARNLSRNKTDLIGLVFHQMSSGFYATVMEGLDNATRHKGYHILTAISRDTEREQNVSLSMFDAARVDGLILLDSGLGDDTIQHLKSYGRPFVLLQKEVDDPEVNTVTCDNLMGAYKATQHLLDLGYQDLLFLTGPKNAQDSQLRMEGCLQALKDKGIPKEQYAFREAHFDPKRAPIVFSEYAHEHGLPRAVFSFNDAMALSLLKHLRESGVDVPSQVAIIGFDGIDCGSYMGLTTVSTPILEMGHAAVDLLLNQIQSGSKEGRHIMLDTTLKIRGTCGAKA